MITDRQKKILNILIEEYINSAEPVSSQILAERGDFDLCSATMRIEMQNLTNLGFLEKPYISSGRIPTDKAYRIFVDDFFEDMYAEEESNDLFNIFKDSINEFKIAKDLTDVLANISSSYIVLSFPQKNVSWQAGFNDIIKEPEFADKEYIVRFFSFIDRYLSQQEKINLESGPRVFIGEENPYEGGEDLSLICFEDVLNNKEKFRLSLIGPKRMNYRKNMNLINSLLKIIDEKI
ncbi:MAG: hypothetical protein PHX52_02575 [Candidatus Pacebacteria bacterium]|nr:hypothetical protein [Candidatus Paceibacterota bacterium]MDD3919445.1 hypothetical protein [Candidatus Paceibacterota bacterium]